MKKMLAIIMILAMAVSLCACKRGNESADDNSAFGNTASGSAIEEVSKYSLDEIRSVTPLLYLHNSRNAYRVYNGSRSEIQQLSFEGRVLSTITVPEPSTVDEELEMGLTIQKVTDSEILFSVDKDNDEEELWSIPVKRDGGATDQPQIDQAEKILSVEADLSILYVDEQYISYVAYEDFCTRYKEYDRIQRKNIVIAGNDTKFEYYFPGTHGDARDWYGEINLHTVLLTKSGKTQDCYPYNLYVHQVGSEKVKKIATDYATKYYGSSMTSSGDRIYFTGINKSVYKNKMKWDIWCYDCVTKKKKKLYTEKQLRQIFHFTELGQLYLDDETLYIYAYGKKKECVIGCPVSEDGVPQKADVINDYISGLSKEENDGATIEAIRYQKCFVSVWDDEKDDDTYRCYDLIKKEEIEVDNEDINMTLDDWYDRLAFSIGNR